VGSETDAGESLDRRLSDSNRAWLDKIVDGRYRVLEVIGRGGMGVVYRVQHLRMGKVAAMKVLHRDLAGDAEVIARFEREAAAVSKLHHPHTVQVFDFGTAQGALYLIMEFVRGADLARVLGRDGPMKWERAAPILAQICGALQEAHELGIVHRDLKPENVLITRSTGGRDYAKVLDFGLAKLDERTTPALDSDRQIVGTPYFMAPEQIRGEDVDARTDIYSFGALMFELLTGQHLYDAQSSVGVLTKHLTAEPDAPSNRTPKLGIPPQADHICRRALARDPSERWQSAAQLGEAIEEAFHETVVEATGQRRRQGSTQLRPTLIITDEELHDPSEIRLRRSDIDAYERSLKVRRAVVTSTVTLAVLGGIAAGVWLMLRPPKAVTEEHEPNNGRSDANRIDINTEVTGYLGKRIGPRAPDIDTYIVPSTGQRRVVTATVTSPPNIDVNLTIEDAGGIRRAVTDEAPLGGAEAIHRRRIDGAIIVTVTQTVAPGTTFVTENVSDPYTLVVTEERADTGEVEPNNSEADATAWVPGAELHGYLDARLDIDLLRFGGEAGTYSVVVRADGVPLAWSLAGDKPRTPGAATLTLTPGQLVRIERTDRGEATGTLPGRDAPWSIVAVKAR